MRLTLFYDGYCPLCVAEMTQLAELDKHNRLDFADIQTEDFTTQYPHIDPTAADRVLHAQFEDGTMLYGLDVTYQAWKLVDKKPWLVVLRWPVVRWFADAAYLFFARNRYTISYLFTGKRRCDTCRIELKR
ncbi:MAG: thiol-disulfide oxidoreductase DCC family protein [Pseudomonadales bacterium]